MDRLGGFFRDLLQEGEGARDFAGLRLGETTGRPLGSAKWMKRLEQQTGRMLTPQKRGPKVTGKVIWIRIFGD